MDKQALIEKIKTMGASPSCYPDLKVAVKKYLDALGTKREKIAAEELLSEIEADVVLTDQLVIFAHSNSAIEMFGAKRAKQFAANADELKRRGEKYCNCLACTYGLEILANKDILLG
ncbi:MAG: heat-shock protein Hsp90 [Selenomonadaceae bacterium]|nr:heat-shock protein Hsp90 [Selenomonadaceae bacterium]